MAPPIEVEEDIGFHRREWVVQRIAWTVVLALLIAAGLGVFGGGGPLSTSVARNPDGTVEVGYDKYGRRGGNESLAVQVEPALVRDGAITLSLSSDFLDDFQVESITPQPSEESADGDRVTYRWTAGGQPSMRTITFALRPQVMGPVDVTLTAIDGSQVSFSQFMYP